MCETVQDRVSAKLSRWALILKRMLNLLPLIGRLARKPLEIGLSSVFYALMVSSLALAS